MGSGETAALSAWHARLVMRNAYVHGSMPYGFYGSPPTVGLSLGQSTASLTNVLIYGGDGQDTSYPDFRGANAISAWGSTLELVNAELRGGAGHTQPGGTGLALSIGSAARRRELSTFGGSGTPAGAGTTLDGTSALTDLDPRPRDLEAASPMRVGQKLSITLHGRPGEAIVLHTSLRPGLAPDPGGPFRLLDPSSEVSVFATVVPPTGTLTLSSPVPDLGPHSSLEVFFQAWHLDVHGHARRGPSTASWSGTAGPGSSVLLLGAGY